MQDLDPASMLADHDQLFGGVTLTGESRRGVGALGGREECFCGLVPATGVRERVAHLDAERTAAVLVEAVAAKRQLVQARSAIECTRGGGALRGGHGELGGTRTLAGDFEMTKQELGALARQRRR